MYLASMLQILLLNVTFQLKSKALDRERKGWVSVRLNPVQWTPEHPVVKMWLYELKWNFAFKTGFSGRILSS